MERQRPPVPEHNAGYRAQDIEQEKGGKGGKEGKGRWILLGDPAFGGFLRINAQAASHSTKDRVYSLLQSAIMEAEWASI